MRLQAVGHWRLYAALARVAALTAHCAFLVFDLLLMWFVFIFRASSMERQRNSSPNLWKILPLVVGLLETERENENDSETGLGRFFWRHKISAVPAIRRRAPVLFHV